jgi:cell division cycle 14
MRIVRPGTVVGPQQQYMYVKQMEWAKWAAVDEIKRQRREEAKLTVATTVRQTVITPATPPADNEEEEEITQLTTTTTIAIPTTPPPVAMPPVTPSRHIAAAAAQAKEIAPPGQPRKTPAAKRTSLAMEDSDEEEEKDDVLPALAIAPPVRRTKPKPASTRPTGSRTAVSERPVRVLRSTTAAASKRNDPAMSNPAPSPASKTTKPNGPLPNKIPRLANETTARSTAASSQKSRQPPPPTPSRLPTLIPTRRTNRHAASSIQETPVAIAAVVKAAQSADWMTNNASAVVKPGTKSERPNLRPIRRRRSSFSAADVVA